MAIYEVNEWLSEEYGKPPKVMSCECTKTITLTLSEVECIYEALRGLCANIEERERDTDTSYDLLDGWTQMNFLENKLESVKLNDTSFG